MALRLYPLRTPGNFGHPKAKFFLGLLHAPCGPPFTVRRQVQKQASTIVMVASSRNHEVLPDCSGHSNVCQVVWEVNDHKDVTSNFMYMFHSLLINVTTRLRLASL